MPKFQSCHSRRGGYQVPHWLQEAEQEFLRRQDERQSQEALLPPKIGRNPNTPYHPLFNPSQEDEARQAQAFKTQWDKENRSSTQEQYWRQAVELIKSGQVKSYEDLGLRFRYTSGQRWGEPFTEHWARLLVKKMIVRKVFTEAEIAVLIPDQTKHSNKKESK